MVASAEKKKIRRKQSAKIGIQILHFQKRKVMLTKSHKKYMKTNVLIQFCKFLIFYKILFWNQKNKIQILCLQIFSFYYLFTCLYNVFYVFFGSAINEVASKESDRLLPSENQKRKKRNMNFY